MENLGVWLPLALEIGLLIVGGILFFVRLDFILKSIKGEVKELETEVDDMRKENQKNVDDIHTKLNRMSEYLVEVKTNVENLVRERRNGGNK